MNKIMREMKENYNTAVKVLSYKGVAIHLLVRSEIRDTRYSDLICRGVRKLGPKDMVSSCFENQVSGKKLRFV